MSDTTEVLERLYQLHNVKNDAELARKLNIGTSTISNWRTRDTVPYKICVEISKRDNVSLDWLLTGKELTNVNKPKTQAIIEMIENLDDSQKQKVYAVIEDEKRFAEMKKRIDQLERKTA
ncbi:helix-turn-helix transcriptional regulator [Beggiatoa leptomitoformis]|uniref:HTH cro/C1-type domain-containing protein n=1 Tax=Beggiatoa leptomitoformis TaxID=288004 RepID=A0A2N9YBS0_9GAMM|nr:helix-turn-helix transcriptional regulator [Beggiatoa leptomitoformis]ALG66776.1 hypothetical protein AL038_02425 [Beggiatoa leptomitoformis]AUI67879.1 hypothetical protein BLE401_03620 [Beggiatoa leptomitoformis]